MNVVFSNKYSATENQMNNFPVHIKKFKYVIRQNHLSSLQIDNNNYIIKILSNIIFYIYYSNYSNITIRHRNTVER